MERIKTKRMISECERETKIKLGMEYGCKPEIVNVPSEMKSSGRIIYCTHDLLNKIDGIKSKGGHNMPRT
jgi:hypothetical protein